MTIRIPDDPHAGDPGDGRAGRAEASVGKQRSRRWLLAGSAALAMSISAAIPVLRTDIEDDAWKDDARKEMQASAHASLDTEPESLATRDPNRRPPLRVRVEPVREGRIERGGEVTGVVRAFRSATVSAETAGRVLERYVEPGDTVEAKQPLLRLEDTRLRLAVEQARAKVAARKIDVEEAGRELDRGEELARGKTISKSRREALGYAVERARSGLALAEVSLRETERALADATVRAPFPGSIETVHVDVGDYLAPGTPVTSLVDLSRARLRAGVTAAEATQLAAGAQATAIFEDLGGAAIPGEIRSIGRVADPASGTYQVEMWLDNPEARLRDGMVGRLRFPLAGKATHVIVPRSALVRQDGRLTLFVVEESPEGLTAHARPVLLGRSDAEQVEVLEGTALGDRVVTHGLFALRDGATVQVEADLASTR
ncbi:MAG: efflux RND transporter periplasmic adaptor subunit [Deltaproteobacteria bacterium]|nr:efflux RND transporter periplasmic adaptor subunit [Deltaproteobacteria bacterium]MBW2417871.1 efflux RND transporter periplasmic adaptor subunit [Deltaproteobacteria bacterium]